MQHLLGIGCGGWPAKLPLLLLLLVVPFAGAVGGAHILRIMERSSQGKSGSTSVPPMVDHHLPLLQNMTVGKFMIITPLISALSQNKETIHYGSVNFRRPNNNYAPSMMFEGGTTGRCAR